MWDLDMNYLSSTLTSTPVSDMNILKRKKHRDATHEIIIFVPLHASSAIHYKLFQAVSVYTSNENQSLPTPARTAYTVTPLSLTQSSFWSEHL